MKIRRASIDDLEKIMELYSETIRNVNKKDYTAEEIELWISGNSNAEMWKEKINEQHFFVAELEGAIKGFGSVTNDGYVDFIFVHKDFPRKGIASKLYDEIERVVEKLKLDKIWANVSITARPFFRSKGFSVIKTYKTKTGDVEFEDCVMTKILNQKIK